MITWTIPKQDIFLVPFPCPGKTEGWTFPRTVTILDKETKKEHEFQVLNHWGVYDIDKIPNSLTQLSTQKTTISGTMFGGFLKIKQPDFKHAERMFFYQLIKI